MAETIDLDFYKALCAKRPDLRLRSGEPLSSMCTFRTGGPAALYAEPRSKPELLKLFRFAKEEGLPVFILGGGSNVLFADEGLKALAIRLRGEGFDFMEILKGSGSGTGTGTGYGGGSGTGIGSGGGSGSGTGSGGGSETAPPPDPKDPPDGLRPLKAGAGAGLGRLVRFACENSLEGMEDLAGIPGTLGGALFMNAGAGSQTISDHLLEMEALDPERLEYVTLQKKDLSFSYRSLRPPFKGFVAVSALFGLKRAGRISLVEERIKRRLEERRRSLPSEPSAGSFFKNPEGLYAGRLIESVGFKGRRRGGAMVSMVHANVIVNAGGARTSDVLKLAFEIQSEVEARHGVRLEREVRAIDFHGNVNQESF
jgi:UDP-N-acetylmuramate dehydrogenase